MGFDSIECLKIECGILPLLGRIINSIIIIRPVLSIQAKKPRLWGGMEWSPLDDLV